MKNNSELKKFALILGIFFAVYFLPVGNTKLTQAILESITLLKWYAREHVILCLVPAFFVAGVIAVFISRASVVRYFGAQAEKWLSYTVAALSGSILAVCSCTILPLFSGIYRRGAGLGPAIAFLYSGPAINIMAIILTARILGPEIGIARVIGAVFFSIVIGLIMQWIYRKEEKEKSESDLKIFDEKETRPLWQTASLFFILVGILVFANWGQPQTETGLWFSIWTQKWLITGFFSVLLAIVFITILRIKTWKVLVVSAAVGGTAILLPGNQLLPFVVSIAGVTWIISQKEELRFWRNATWGFAKQILPLLGMGVMIAGFLLGSPEGGEGLIPSKWIAGLVGGNSLRANLLASIVGAFMYFATLTEVPILQGLMVAGMGKGPALAPLLAGPALSLPNMLVIVGVMGLKKTILFVVLVVVMATFSGFIFGLIV